MRSSFADLNTAMRALMASQYALSVVNHNISNANTEGYSRQAAKLSATEAFPIPAFNRAAIVGQLGTGVQVDMIQRYRNDFVDLQLRTESESLSQWKVTQDILQQAELYFHEPSENGLNAALSRFWNSWTEVGNSPQDVAVRQALRENATDLAGVIKSTYGRLSALRADVNDQIGLKVQEINSLAERIAALNGQIVKVQSIGYQPNDLRDQRDLLVDQLSQLIDISYTETSTGAMAISVGGRNLVFNQEYRPLAAVPDPANGNLYSLQWQEDGSALTVMGGELKGLLDLRDVSLPGMQATLNEMAAALVAQVNAAHRAGYGLNGATAQDFFTATPGSEAATIAVAPAIAADVASIASATSADAPGDGSNALAIAAIQQQKVMSGGTASIDGFYQAFISQLGVDVSNAKAMTDNQQVLVQQLTQRKQEESGVSLDEEAIDLIRYQRAYQAASRMVTTIDEMLDQVINRMGLVGRS